MSETIQMRDTLTIDASGLSMTSDGYLVGDARVSRAGNVQQYYGSEIGLTGYDAGQIFGVYRDPSVVFDEKSMLSLAGRPVTRGHPPSGVGADNWKDLAVGQMGGVIRRDGEHVVAPMAIMDATAAKEVFGGARSLSAGYTVGIVRDAGTADGAPYQFRQAGELRFNHVAYLPDNNPRAGNTRIGDSWGPAPVLDSKPGDPPINREKGGRMADEMKAVILGDSVVQIPVADVAAVEQFKTDSAKALADAESKHTTAIAAKDEEIGKLKADLKVAQDAANIDVDALVTARTDLVAQVKTIDASIDPKGKTDGELKKAAVAAKLGDAMVADASDAEIAGMFKAIASAKAGNPVADAIQGGVKPVGDAVTQMNDAHTKSVSDLNAWRTAQ